MVAVLLAVLHLEQNEAVAVAVVLVLLARTEAESLAAQVEQVRTFLIGLVNRLEQLSVRAVVAVAPTATAQLLTLRLLAEVVVVVLVEQRAQMQSLERLIRVVVAVAETQPQTLVLAVQVLPMSGSRSNDDLP